MPRTHVHTYTQYVKLAAACSTLARGRDVRHARHIGNYVSYTRKVRKTCVVLVIYRAASTVQVQTRHFFDKTVHFKMRGASQYCNSLIHFKYFMNLRTTNMPPDVVIRRSDVLSKKRLRALRRDKHTHLNTFLPLFR